MKNQYYTPKYLKYSLNTPVQYITPQYDTSVSNITSIAQNILKLFFSQFNLISGNIQYTICPEDHNKTILIITVPYYVNPVNNTPNVQNINNIKDVPTSKQLYGLQDQLKDKLNLTVKIKLIKLQAAYLDATVLAKYISNGVEKNRFRFVALKIFSEAIRIHPKYELDMPSSLVGIKIKLSGRLKSEKTKPRQTIQILTRGSLLPSSETMLSIGSHTFFNKKGSYTVRVWINQKMWNDNRKIS